MPGLIVRDDELTPVVVEHLIGGLVLDAERLAAMSAAARSLGARDADERLADMVTEAAGWT